MLEPTSPVQRKLRNWQTQLLDLSRANRLLYFKVERASTVPLVRPAADDLFQALVARGKALIVPLPGALTLIDLDQPEDAPAAPPPDTSAVNDTPATDQTPLELAVPDRPEAASSMDSPKPTRKRLSNELASSL